MATKKNLLIVGHTRSGGHFLMNAISLNFPHYIHHRFGKDLCKKSHPELTRRALKGIPLSREIQISRQQAWSFDLCKDHLDRDYKIIYIMRNGKDVVGSLYDMHTKIYNWSKVREFSSFISSPLAKNSYENRINYRKAENVIDSWLLHWKSWVEFLGKEKNVISYEKLYYHFSDTIHKIACILEMEPLPELCQPDKNFNCVKPREGCPGQWKKLFLRKDVAFYNNYVLQHKGI